MRYVHKGSAPAAFEAWKAQTNADWQPGYGDLQNPEKALLHATLIAEQGQLCCYCGRRITLADSHIEHFQPQRYSDLALDFANLHASCIREPLPRLPLHCGHAKGNDFDETLAIRPTSEDCERRFLYIAGTGDIRSVDLADAAADYMIGLLQLNIASLRNQRKDVLTRTFDLDFSVEELAQLIEGCRRSAGIEFEHVMARYAECLLEQRAGSVAGGVSG